MFFKPPASLSSCIKQDNIPPSPTLQPSALCTCSKNKTKNHLIVWKSQWRSLKRWCFYIFKKWNRDHQIKRSSFLFWWLPDFRFSCLNSIQKVVPINTVLKYASWKRKEREKEKEKKRERIKIQSKFQIIKENIQKKHKKIWLSTLN